MRLLDICSILHAKIPQQTNEFSDTQSATLSISSGVVTVTATAHGLSIGDTFTLSGFVLDENINYSHTVVSVPDVDTFTFTIIQQFITATNQNGILHKNIRIYPTVSVQIAVDSYSKLQNGTYKKVMYIVDLGMTSSKDRNISSDASFEMIRSTDFKISTINRFGVLTILPIKNDTVGANAADFARAMIKNFVKTIVGRQLPTDWENTQSSAISLISSSREVSNNSFIVQNYTFETTEYIGVADVNDDDFGYNVEDIKLVVIPKIGE
ncbi:MAG: hypothetical protein OQL19_11735 [Gammaproteobacteria bacterium]|nr:hypothetical protein [Gammaproteobacteria bacterium]